MWNSFLTVRVWYAALGEKTMQAAAAEKKAAEAAAKAEADKASSDGGGEEGKEEEASEEDEGAEMPDIEVLSDTDEDRSTD